MSSAELPLTKDPAAAAGPYVARIFFRSLLSFLAVDIVVMLCFDGALWQWAVLTGVETRSSSPVRVVRNERFQSSLEGVYPCGEGCGYAGGIVSAAVDGIRVAEAIARERA